MDKFEFAQGLGKRIIKSHHHFFEDNDSEDLDHIVTLKRTIAAIAEYLKSEGIQEDKIKTPTDYYPNGAKVEDAPDPRRPKAKP